jgi:hypothetical protein
VVNSTADPGDVSTCTLRQAIVSMNIGAVAPNSACTNTGGSFGSNDTINFSSSLFGSGTPVIGLYTTLIASHDKTATYPPRMDLAIDAGAGRTVAIERPATATAHFSVIGAFLGGGNLDLTGLVVRNGYSSNYVGLAKYGSDMLPVSGGGGVYGASSSVSLNRCEISNNTAKEGAGVFVKSGALTMNASTVSGNLAKSKNITPGGARYGLGAGVMTVGGKLSLTDSTISNNVSYGTYRGAAIAGWKSNVSLVNSTISGNNNVAAGAAAGSIHLINPSGLSVINSTLACNSGGPAIYLRQYDFGPSKPPPAKMTAISTIFADTTNSRCTTGTSYEVSARTSEYANSVVMTGDHNLVISGNAIDAKAPFPADTVVGDPLLGSLQNNGGPTPTHAPGAGSPAIDAGSNPGNLVYDQRGADFARWVGKAPDIGAYEDQTSHLCGSANGHSFTSLNSGTPNLCSSGAYLQGGPFGGGPWSWFCASSSNPAQNEFCGAQVLASTSLLIENASGGIISGAVWGQPLHLKAVASRSGTGPAPTGTMSFFDVTGGGFVPVCMNLTVSGGGTVCDTTSTPIDAGSRQFEAVYNGDGTFGTAMSSPGSIQINPAASTTAIASQTPNPVALGASFTTVANVTANTPSEGTPVGTVQITDQTDNLICTYALDASTPGCAITPKTAGAHTLLVAYLGNDNIAGSSVGGTESITGPQLGLTVDDGAAYAQYGKTLQYVVKLSNTGNGSASSVAMSGTQSVNLGGSTLTWQCATQNGATCAASGSGASLNDTVTLPAGSSLTWTVTVTVPAAASGNTVTFAASATGAASVSDTDTLVIFRNGFD